MPTSLSRRGHPVRACAAVVLGFACAARVAGAQTDAERPARYAASLAIAPHAERADHAPPPHDRTIAITSVERRFELLTRPWGGVALVPELLPLVYTTGNRRSRTQPCGFFDVCVVGEPYASFGAGVAPLAGEVHTSRTRRVSVALRVGGGAIAFSPAIPTPQGTRVNFIAQGGGSVTVRAARRLWLDAGWRYTHLSNGGRGAVNPGINAPLLSLGASWR